MAFHTVVKKRKLLPDHSILDFHDSELQRASQYLPDLIKSLSDKFDPLRPFLLQISEALKTEQAKQKEKVSISRALALI
jgi:hypothetical protein